MTRRGEHEASAARENPHGGLVVWTLASRDSADALVDNNAALSNANALQQRGEVLETLVQYTFGSAPYVHESLRSQKRRACVVIKQLG